jgi:hypothetical protein
VRKRNILEDAFVFLLSSYLDPSPVSFHKLHIKKKTKRGLRKVLVAGGGGDWEPNKTKAKSTWDSFNIFPPRLRSLFSKPSKSFYPFLINDPQSVEIVYK